ncbi:DUF4232 domain-containing protein [Streptomyces lydicus]|uniref:DUF4232 domain-containing protein n=1 Tax=Streptomyces lydicus TaxID=47763 RepID=UPI0005256D10|nr:DUF4232 domain-containing protein [Streptomyces lydicus]MDC7335827.1 DUF4232 domain-containing protein [Streptomyces lydicus]UEG94928.1 DUF4232 domain-containing protein [Streptomyces lydicus]
MLRRSLLGAATAALALTVIAGLGLVGCGSPRMATLHANCTTKGLKWKLTVLHKAPHSTHRDARLSVVNKSARPCVFGGYPLFEVHVGKGPEADGAGRGTPSPIDLRGGGTVTTALRYKDSDSATRPASTAASPGCIVSNDEAIVAAPHDYEGGRRPIVARDEAGRRTLLDVCEDTIWMSPPAEVAK